MTRRSGFLHWLLEGRSADPMDRAIEPLVRVAMVIGVMSSVLVVWVGWIVAVDRTQFTRYALVSTPLQLTGLLGSLALLQRRGPEAAARFFGGFVIVTLSMTSIVLGAEMVSASVVRLIVPTIVLAVSLRAVESLLWVLGVIAAAWIGVLLAPFSALSAPVQLEVVGRLATASLVVGTSHMILVVLRNALRREIAAAAASALQLARAQRVDSLGRLAAGTAHDFNGLLGAIMLTAEEIEDAPSAAERARAVTSIKALVQQSTDLTKRLLQYARGDGGREEGMFDLRETIDEALAAVRPTYGRRIKVTRSGADLPLPVRGSSVELRQVMTNLLMNAGDAIQGDGAVRIAIDVREGGSERMVRVAVSDSGPGVDPSVRDHLFEPFVSTKRTGKGTGLGLSTAQAIVERHRGALAFDADAPASGATFVITLPLTLTT